MAFPLSNTAEGGTNTTQVTVGNSGGASGDAFEVVSGVANSSSTTFDNTHPAHGALGIKYVGGTVAGTNYTGWSTSVGTPTEVWGRCYLYATANPGAGIAVFAVSDLSGTGACAYIGFDSSGFIRCGDTVGTTAGAVAVGLNQQVRIEFHILCSATVGIVEAKLFNSAESSTPSETITRSGANTRANMNAFYFGFDSQQPASYTYFLDTMSVNGTGYPGPFNPPSSSGFLPQFARIRFS